MDKLETLYDSYLKQINETWGGPKPKEKTDLYVCTVPGLMSGYYNEILEYCEKHEIEMLADEDWGNDPEGNPDDIRDIQFVGTKEALEELCRDELFSSEGEGHLSDESGTIYPTPLESIKPYEEMKEIVKEELETPSEEDIERLEEIRDELKELIEEAKNLVRGTHQYERARSYWIPHILGAIDKDNEYMGGSMINMQDTIDALREESEPEVDDGEDPRKRKR